MPIRFQQDDFSQTYSPGHTHLPQDLFPTYPWPGHPSIEIQCSPLSSGVHQAIIHRRFSYPTELLETSISSAKSKEPEIEIHDDSSQIDMGRNPSYEFDVSLQAMAQESATNFHR
jgi:hypothetical protein